MSGAHLLAVFRPNISDLFDLCLHWVFVVYGSAYIQLVNNKVAMRTKMYLLTWSISGLFGSN